MVTRVSGMVSGLDVDSLVKKMMDAKRIPLDKLTQQKQTLQWQRDNYREINSKLVDFRNSKLAKYDSSVALNTQVASVSGNTAALKAEATADANGVPMTLEVSKLAKPISWETAGMPTTDGTGKRIVTTSSKLSDLQTLNGGTPAPIAGKYNVSVNNISMDFDQGMSISDVVNKINSNTEANVTATFDEVSGKFSIASKTYGADGKLSLSTGSNNLLSLFGSTGAPYNIVGYQQAEVKINGSAAVTKFDSNMFQLNGIKFTLFSTSTAATTTTVSTQSDTTKALESITSFVKDYNDLLSGLQSKVDEERYKDYTPLTDAQKKDMTDSDVTLWEKKAKSGLLRNDEILKGTIASMRSELADKLGDLSSIGITTGQYYENGKLYIDETKLKQALSSNPQKVVTLFQGSASVDGLFDKLKTNIDTALNKFAVKAGTSKFTSDLTASFKSDSFMGKQLVDYNNRISTLQSRLSDQENNYYKKFTAMETAMNKYNAQSASLSSYSS